MSTQNPSPDLSSPEAPDGGKLLNMETRTARSVGSKGNAISSNLTDFGRKYHGIDAGDELRIAVYENGIWISK